MCPCACARCSLAGFRLLEHSSSPWCLAMDTQILTIWFSLYRERYGLLEVLLQITLQPLLRCDHVRCSLIFMLKRHNHIIDLHQRFFRPANHEGNVVEASRLAPENALSSNTDQPHDPAKSRRRGYKHLTDSPTAVDGLDLLHHQNL